MSTQTTNTELLHGGPLRAALNACDVAECRREALMPPGASVEAADGLDGTEGDDLAPARGIVAGVMMGAMLWSLIGAAVFAAVGR